MGTVVLIVVVEAAATAAFLVLVEPPADAVDEISATPERKAEKLKPAASTRPAGAAWRRLRLAVVDVAVVEGVAADGAVEADGVVALAAASGSGPVRGRRSCKRRSRSSMSGSVVI